SAALDPLVLVEREVAAGAAQVVVAAPVVVLIVVIDADDEPVRPVEPEAVVAVAEAAADELPVEVDDAAGRDRAARRAGEGVLEVPPGVVVPGGNRVAFAERH